MTMVYLLAWVFLTNPNHGSWARIGNAETIEQCEKDKTSMEAAEPDTKFMCSTSPDGQ